VNRHDLDPVALCFGALFTVVGLGYAVARWNWSDFWGAWALAMGLIILGFAGILSRTRRRPEQDPQREL
jgi:hypothetical protein